MAVLDPGRNLPRSQKVLLGVIGLVVAAAIGYFFLLAPKMLERDTLHQRNESLKADVAKARLDESNMRQFRVQASALRKRLEAARERMPGEKEIPGLYRRITDLAAQSGLSVAVFAPKPPEERDVYSEVPISVIAEGSYHQLGQFFEQVGRLPRIVATNDMRLVGIDRPTGSVRAELGLATYVFRPEGAPPPARPAGAAPPPSSAQPAGGRS
jgi:type IV pilus assembly protein PilO